MSKRLLSSSSAVTVTAVALLALPGSSHAFEADPGRCYSKAPLWSAGKGRIVSGVSDGPIKSVLNGVGEARTHSMMSNGDWATHSTSLAPSLNNQGVYVLGVRVGTAPNPDRPLKANELAAGQPGFTQINMGGAYTYWRQAAKVWTQVAPPAIDAPNLCGNSCQVSGTADWLWSTIPYQTNASFFELGFLDGGGVFRHMSYGFHQYMDGRKRITTGLESEDWTGRGIVCSQVAPYAYEHWLDVAGVALPSNAKPMSYQTYSRDETIAAGSALWNTVYDGCMDAASPGFWGAIGGVLIDLIVGDTEDICIAAAWQVLNCFFEGETASSGGCTDASLWPWHDYKLNPAKSGARSLSPDGLQGLNGKPATGPWANWTIAVLQWNGGGSTYGCYW